VKIDWPDDRCIICLGRPSDDPMSARDEAHVIPQSLDGKLRSPFLCRRCNNDLGSKVEGQLPRDIFVLELVDRLENTLPSRLVNKIRRHAGFFVDTEIGRIGARRDEDGVLRVVESGSVVTDRNALRLVEAELRRLGVDETARDAKLAAFAAAARGSRFEISPALTLVKGEPTSALDWRRTYDEPMASRAAPLVIAYLYLALCIGGHVYADALQPTRDALLAAIAGDDTLETTWPFPPMRTKAPPEPKHALAVEQEHDGVLVKVWLFKELHWRVPFPNVRLRGVAPFYLLDLTTGEESCA
jgi:hypothetical protein